MRDVLECGRMPLASPPESGPYRVTLFFGPDPVDEQPHHVACVFNVKKRSWKAGIQVSVEIGTAQLSALAEQLGLSDRLSSCMRHIDPEQRADYEARVPDLFAQAVAWCKLDLQLDRGITQENQRLPAGELETELAAVMPTRTEYVLSYILTELDVADGGASPSSH
ncbi:hypothetical protein [Nitrospira moscoviensis]|uniref:Uncharacterized protein n=1 Tax=Nitrospira moscoviensis TaxID=42253 RepID=A0A0K2G7N8_NITMO|nr:hypothetical protein [Nitrospira moscoviensis]ALA56627.1 hypothetical protein NITMOv2_0187 [Nitrospira moscoviensis]